MPESSDRRQSRDPAFKHPQTLSLPIIPAIGAPTQGPKAPRRDSGANPRVSRPQPEQADPGSSYGSRRSRIVPDIATTEDEDDDLGVYSRSYDVVPVPTRAVTLPSQQLDVPNTQEMLAATSRALTPISSVTGRAVGHILSRPRRPAPPPRSMRRGIVWQVILLGVMAVTFVSTLRSVGDPAGAKANAFSAKSGAQKDERITNRVPTFIQIDPTIGYKSNAQYQEYSGGDCGAAATAEVLTAWGDRTGNIGQVIDDMGNDLTSGGLQNREAFQRVATAQHFNITMTDSISAAQLANIVSVQGIPVIIGVRDNFGGYYSYFAPGHFLVVTGADANGFNIVDSSTYFVHYLPIKTFMDLWDHPRAIILTPQNYNFQMP